MRTRGPLFLLVAALVLPLAGATDAPRLPIAVANSAGASDGQAILLFGGQTWNGKTYQPTDRILAFSPEGGRVADAGRLTVPVLGAGAAFVNGTFYVLGGSTENGPTFQILRYRDGNVTPSGIYLPSPLSNAAVAPAGGAIIVMGGLLPCTIDCGRTHLSRAIYAYHPERDNVTTSNATFPEGLAGPAVSDGRYVYTVGGLQAPTGAPVFTDRIFRYDPERDRLDELAVRLPVPTMGAGLLALGDWILIAGGETDDGPQARIFGLNTSSQQMEESSIPLPAARSGAALVAFGERAFLFGGTGCDQRRCDTILEVDPAAAISKMHPLPPPRGIPFPWAGAVLLAVSLAAARRVRPS